MLQASALPQPRERRESHPQRQLSLRLASHQRQHSEIRQQLPQPAAATQVEAGTQRQRPLESLALHHLLRAWERPLHWRLQ